LEGEVGIDEQSPLLLSAIAPIFSSYYTPAGRKMEMLPPSPPDAGRCLGPSDRISNTGRKGKRG